MADHYHRSPHPDEIHAISTVKRAEPVQSRLAWKCQGLHQPDLDREGGCVAIILPNFVARYLDTCAVVDDPGGSAYGRSGRAAMPLAVSSLRDGTLVDNGPTAGDANGGVAGASCESCASFSLVLAPAVLGAGPRKSYSPNSSARARTPGIKPSRELMTVNDPIRGLANFSKQPLEALNV